MQQPEGIPIKIFWRKFRKNPLAMGGLVFILFVILVSLFGPFIRPDKTVNANDQNLLLSSQKPNFEVGVIRVKNPQEHVNNLKTWLDGGKQKNFVEIPIQEIETTNDSVFIETFSASGVGDKRSFSKLELEIEGESKTLSSAGKECFVAKKKFILGTDKYGRDLLSRLMAGSVISLAVGAIAVVISLLIGLTLGLIAGYYRGWVDNVIMWFTNVVWAIPTLILVMAITFAFGTGFWKVFLAVGLTMWVEVARIARGQVLSVREKEYVEAARALGFSEMRIIFKHILPNILSPIIVISAANFAGAILIEAGLSFLGLGAQIPTPSWGNMIREHYAFITTDLAYLAILPGVCIMLLVLSFMMVGNGLRDALDVRA